MVLSLLSPLRSILSVAVTLGLHPRGQPFHMTCSLQLAHGLLQHEAYALQREAGLVTTQMRRAQGASWKAHPHPCLAQTSHPLRSLC